MKKWVYPFSASIVSAMCLGCNVTPAIAPRNDVQATSMQTIPLASDLEFRLNQFFLWPENVTPEVISRVLTLGDEIEHLETEIWPRKALLQRLNRDLAEVDAQILAKTGELSSKTGPIFKKTADRKRANERLEAAQKLAQQEREKPTPEPDVLKKMDSEVVRLQTLVATLTRDLDTLSAQKIEIEAEIQRLKETPSYSERVQALQEIQSDEREETERISNIRDLVTYYEPSPGLVSFHPRENGRIKIDIMGWCLDRETQKKWDFSTDPIDGGRPTIDNVRYSDVGGVIEFDAKVYLDEARTQLRETYSFRIARIKYEANDGKLYYNGTMKRIRTNTDGTVEVRRGAAKLTKTPVEGIH